MWSEGKRLWRKIEVCEQCFAYDWHAANEDQDPKPRDIFQAYIPVHRRPAYPAHHRQLADVQLSGGIGRIMRVKHGSYAVPGGRLPADLLPLSGSVNTLLL